MLAKENLSMDDLLAEISSDRIAQKVINKEYNDTMETTSLADYSVNTDGDRTQPLVLTKHSLVNTLMPPVPDSPDPSPTTSPKKVTFANTEEKSRVLPPIVHDLSMHSMPELAKRSNWDSENESDDSDLTLASPFPRRGSKTKENDDDQVVNDRVVLETVNVRNGMLVEQVVDLGIVQKVEETVEEPQKNTEGSEEMIPDAESSIIEPETDLKETEHEESEVRETELEKNSDSVIYSPMKTEHVEQIQIHQQQQDDEANDNPFLENATSSGDTSISTFDSANYVLDLPFDDSLYEPMEKEVEVSQKQPLVSTAETSIFDIWNNQNVHASKPSKIEFDCIKSPIKSAVKVAESKLNVKVLDKRIYSNSSSVIDRLEVKPIVEQSQNASIEPLNLSMLTVEFTDMSNHGFTLDDDDTGLDFSAGDAISNNSLQILKSVWNYKEDNKQPVLTLTHSDTFERLHLKTKSMVMQDREAKIVPLNHMAEKITTSELHYRPSQHGEYVHELSEDELEEDNAEDIIHSVEDLGISLPKGDISPARKTMVAKFEQSRKQMELKKEHEKLQETLKHKLREQALKEALLHVVEEKPVEHVVEEEIKEELEKPLPNVGPDHVFVLLTEVRNIKIPDLRKYNGQVQIVLDNGSHIIKTGFYPLDYHGVVKVNEEFELIVDPNAAFSQQLIMTLKVKYDAPQDKVVYTEGKKTFKQIKTKWWKKTETVEVKSAPVKSVIKAVDPVKGYIAPDGSFAKYKFDLNTVAQTRTNTTLNCFNEWMKTKLQKGVVENSVVENICTLHMETKKSSHDTASLSLSCGDVVVETLADVAFPQQEEKTPVDELFSL